MHVSLRLELVTTKLGFIAAAAALGTLRISVPEPAEGTTLVCRAAPFLQLPASEHRP